MKEFELNINKIIDVLSSTLAQNYTESSFYKYIQKILSQYENLLNQYSKDLDSFLVESNEMMGCATSTRFINLIKKINMHCLNILSNAYKGDLSSATKELRSLLSIQKYTESKLVQKYVDYIGFDRFEKGTFVRCVDFKDNEPPTNCNHVPFNLRYKVSKGRFNQIGIPCLYLSNSLECAELEIGENVKDGEKRWYSTFEPKKYLYFADFTIPTQEGVAKMSIYDKFSFLITYPLRIMCLTKIQKEDESFSEEYLFSQLFLHVLFLNRWEDDPGFDGICYSSIKDTKFLNFVIPATYTDKEPPTCGISKEIKSLFKETGPLPL